MVWEERVGLQTGLHQIQWLHFDNDFKQSDTILNVRLMGTDGASRLLGTADSVH